MSLFSWQCQNLCLLSWEFIIDWRVVDCINKMFQDVVSKHCFIYSPEKRGSFTDVRRSIEKHMRPEEIGKADSRRLWYQQNFKKNMRPACQKKDRSSSSTSSGGSDTHSGGHEKVPVSRLDSQDGYLKVHSHPAPGGGQANGKQLYTTLQFMMNAKL